MKTIENTKDYKRNLNGSISCVLNHPSFGEIPNGLSQERDAELIAEIEAAGLVEEPTQAEKDAHEQEQAISQAIGSVQAMLDSEAASRGYDNINAIGKYIGYENPFRAECEALGAWTASCWAKCYELQAGGVMPADLLAEMPILELAG